MNCSTLHCGSKANNFPTAFTTTFPFLHKGCGKDLTILSAQHTAYIDGWLLFQTMGRQKLSDLLKLHRVTGLIEQNWQFLASTRLYIAYTITLVRSPSRCITAILKKSTEAIEPTEAVWSITSLPAWSSAVGNSWLLCGCVP